jgi:hypothetical protein
MSAKAGDFPLHLLRAFLSFRAYSAPSPLEAQLRLDIHTSYLYLLLPRRCIKMSILHTGRRRAWQDQSYNGPARQGPVRHVSRAQLNLERLHEQNRAIIQKRDPSKAPEPAPGAAAAAQGKPRLLLMGQRR